MLRFFLLFLLFLVPQITSAEVYITEIMYDHEGSDTGYEWVEIYNDGSSIPITDWYFYEAETHHRLSSESNITLGSGEYAVIVQNVDTFEQEFGNNVTLLKSSFSLNNTGEELSISNTEKDIQSSITYSVDDGANGNGNSLQKSGSDWIQAIPTPGESNSNTENNSTESTNTTQEKTSTTKKIKKEKYYTPHLELPNSALARSSVIFDAYVTLTNGEKTTKKLKGGVYFLNFGDGSYIELDERINVEHIYQYAGEYEIVFEFYPSRLLYENAEKPEVLKRKKITIHEPKITIVDIENQSAIVIQNNSTLNINIGGWDMKKSESNTVYTFPRFTYIGAGKKLTIPRDIHSLLGIDVDTWVLLRNEHDITLSSFTLNKQKMKTVNGSFSIDTQSTITKESNILDTEDIFLKDTSHLEEFLKEHPQKQYAEFSDTEFINQKTKEDTSEVPINVIFAIGIAALTLAAVRSYQFSKKHKDNNSLPIQGDIELIE